MRLVFTAASLDSRVCFCVCAKARACVYVRVRKKEAAKEKPFLGNLINEFLAGATVGKC